MSSDDEIRAQAFLKYQKDLAEQKVSGSWEIKAEQQELNKKVFALVQDLIPFDDVHKHDDCDLIYRFLIARKWDVQQAAENLRNHMKYRKENKLNNLVWEQFPDELEHLIRFHSVDLEGRPLYLWRPNPSFVAEMMTKYPREMIIRHYMKVIEQGRRITLSLGVDRVTCVFDCCNLSIGILKNMSAMGLLKEISSLIQREYPENLRFMLVLNGGFTFSGVWTVLKALLDERVQKKIQNLGSGNNLPTEIAKYVPLENLPKSYSGTGPDDGPEFRALAEIPSCEPGTRPKWEYGAYKQNPFVVAGAKAIEDLL